MYTLLAFFSVPDSLKKDCTIVSLKNNWDMRKVPWAFLWMVKAWGGCVEVRLCRDWWTSQKICIVTGCPLWDTCSVIGLTRKDPASNRRRLAVLLCVPACGCLLKEKDYISASVIGPAAGWKPQSKDLHISVNRGDLMFPPPPCIFTTFEFLTVRVEKKRKQA